MDHFFQIRATIAHNEETIISVSRSQCRREHDAARCDTEEHKRVNFIGAQEQLEISSCERTDATFRDHRLVLEWRNCLMDRAGVARGLLEEAASFVASRTS